MLFDDFTACCELIWLIAASTILIAALAPETELISRVDRDESCEE